jgi:hypothetical protein
MQIASCTYDLQRHLLPQGQTAPDATTSMVTFMGGAAGSSVTMEMILAPPSGTGALTRHGLRSLEVGAASQMLYASVIGASNLRS